MTRRTRHPIPTLSGLLLLKNINVSSLHIASADALITKSNVSIINNNNNNNNNFSYCEARVALVITYCT